MRRSHLISLFILFFTVSVIILVGSLTGESSETVLSKPTATQTPSPSGGTPPTSVTGTPDVDITPDNSTPTPSPSPTPVVRPSVNVSDYTNLSVQSVVWNVSSTLTEEGNNQSRVYQIDREVAAVVEGYEYIYLKNGDDSQDSKKVYLTFSIAYEDREGSTASILSTLRSNNIQAVFFVTKEYMESNPDIIKTMFDDGHLIGSRGDISVSGSGGTGMAYTSAQTFCDTLWSMEEIYQGIVGDTNRMIYYRPDRFSVRDLALAKAMGYTIVFRSYAYSDWDYSVGYNRALSNLLNNTVHGSVLQLTLSRINADILQDYITQIKQQGFTLERLDK